MKINSSFFFFKISKKKSWYILWAGKYGKKQITTREVERIPKKIINGMCHNTCSVGKSRTRWEDILQRDALQILGIQRWRWAGNTEEWECLLREVRAQMGLQHHTWIFLHIPSRHAGGSTITAPLISWPWHYMGVCGQPQTEAALPLRRWHGHTEKTKSPAPRWDSKPGLSNP